MSVSVRVTEVVKERTNVFGLYYFYFQVRDRMDLFWLSYCRPQWKARCMAGSKPTTQLNTNLTVLAQGKCTQPV